MSILRVMATVMVICLLALSSVFADCIVTTSQNPVTGHEERVTAESDGHDLEIRWSERIGGSWVNELVLSDNTVDDSCPQLAFDATGATAVVWREAGSKGRVIYRARKSVAGVWSWQSPPVLVSDGVNDASRPSVAFVEGQPWVAWHELTSAGLAKIVVANGADGLEPWPSVFAQFELGTTAFAGPHSVQVFREAGHLWITWVQSATELRFRERDPASGTWASALNVTIQGGDVGQAIAAAHQQILE